MLKRTQPPLPAPKNKKLFPMTFFKNSILPVRQAPMAGGITTPQFVAACAKAGFWPVYASGYRDPKQVLNDINQIKQLTTKPFEINLFVPTPRPPITPELKAQIEMYFNKINSFRMQLGLAAESNPPNSVFSQTSSEEEVLNNIVEVILSEKNAVNAVSFTFGCLKPELIQVLKQAGLYVLGSATNVQEASLLLAAGVDAIIAQGYGAGGHRACFLGPDTCLSTIEVVRQLVAFTKTNPCPIIAAGNIMRAQDIHMYLEAGAVGVQMGTALLGTQESGASQTYKKALKECKGSKKDFTTVTDVYTGRPARGIKTTFITEMAGLTIPPKPIPHELSTKLRKEAADKGFPEYMSLWAGEGVHHLQMELPVQELYDELLKSMQDLLKSSNPAEDPMQSYLNSEFPQRRP